MPGLSPSALTAAASFSLVMIQRIRVCLEIFLIIMQLGDFTINLPLLQLIEGTDLLQFRVESSPEDGIWILIISD